MFKSLTMLVGATAGVAAAVAVGAPPPDKLLAHLDGGSSPISALSSLGSSSGSCDTGWSSSPVNASRPVGPSTAHVADIRVGAHGCYDRLVIDLGPGRAAGYRVRYVRAVRGQGSGQVIPLRGRANLEITVDANAAGSFPASSSELANVSGFPALRQVAGAGSFEGQTDIGVGVRARLPFHVQYLSGPGRDSRLVIDVAHRR
jgi:hypothetical protein